ncbi:SDR family oxidoreductase [Oricola cellulosilytica]|uniref:SDR family oxidoreductase n=1 Tax=Oricola cellulosilytica TaxID=1429082 RepID=A0A4V2MP46_9HYPH|nr:SDR family oxidoreductase [Oricola cellulosilytica]TCD16262.1 SDR family oxidoreductase [Oricola cellulosilytica]
MGTKTSKSVREAVADQKGIQQQVDRADERKSDSDEKGAMQAGARRYPEPPFPQGHQEKPGAEHALDPEPMHDAPFYIGSKKLDGRVALITGGDSGIGRAVAVLFAREGADIAISYLSESKDAEETREAVEREGKRCLLLPGDVQEEEYCRSAVEKTVQEFGQLDVLVNNAAFQYHASDFEDLTTDHFDTTIKTNLYGYFFMCKAAVPHLKNGSAIINTGSTTGIDGSGRLVDYSMTKGGIHAFTRALSSNLMDKGIRVNAVAPGPVWTPLNPSERPSDQVSEFGSKAPMKRPAQPEEIAPAYVFLASPHCSSYITGEILPIIGGY